MNLFQNPFYMMGVSTRDSKQKIVECCDAKSLTVDADLCTRYRSLLTQPRNRLSGELAWLPGLSPARSIGLIEKLKKDPAAFLISIDGINPLAKCNSLATFLDHYKPKEESQIKGLLIDIAKNFDRIDIANLMSVINEDRQIAKIPMIQDVENIKQEIQGQYEYIISAMTNSLNNTKAPDKILTDIVATTTSDGNQYPPILIDELTNKYQIEVQKYLDQLVKQIRNIISTIEKQPMKTFEYQMPDLYKYLRAWNQIAQPIQLIYRSKGLDDSQSRELVQDLRGLAVSMANTHAMHYEAKQISKIISEIFSKLPQIMENVSEDLLTLEDIIKRKEQSKAEEQKWRNECSLDIEIGTIFKKRFVISPEMVKFKDDKIPTDKVSRVRWGSTATKRSINFIPIGTTYSYSVWIGNDQKMFHIEPTNEVLYKMIIDKLWNAVCVRLINETLNKLSSGEYIIFGNGDAIVNKDGIMLKKHKLFGHEPYFAKWEDLGLTNGNGTFIISCSSEKKARAELSYRDTENVHILETIMRFLWKDGNYAKLQRGEL